MPQPSGRFDGTEGPAWYCLQTQAKHEHIAAAHLRQQWGLEVYLPRLRFKRGTARGAVWFTEALFPGYVFARFDLATFQRRVHHARGVRGIVHFGDHWPAIPGGAIEELRARIGPGDVHEVYADLKPGDEVMIAAGVFHSLRAVVTRVMSGRERVRVLLEFLGRQTALELEAGMVAREGDGRRRIWSEKAVSVQQSTSNVRR